MSETMSRDEYVAMQDEIQQRYADKMRVVMDALVAQLPKPPDLRDQFAAAALTGILADHTVDGKIEDIAAQSYIAADAMLEARK